MSEADWLDTIIDLLNDESVRTILEETSVTSLSATELADLCNVSQQTVYRRLEELKDVGLVEDRTRVRKDGHHDTVYTATLEHVSITLRDGEFHFEVERTGTEPADRLTDLWRNF